MGLGQLALEQERHTPQTDDSAFDVEAAGTHATTVPRLSRIRNRPYCAWLGFARCLWG